MPRSRRSRLTLLLLTLGKLACRRTGAVEGDQRVEVCLVQPITDPPHARSLAVPDTTPFLKFPSIRNP
jgi:hypothetical protein